MEDGPPGFPQGFSGPVVLRNLSTRLVVFRLRGYHPLWLHFPEDSTTRQFCNSPGESPSSRREALQPRTYNAGELTYARFRLFPVRSPLLGESRLISFPEGTEMFHFPSFALSRLCIHLECAAVLPTAGCPIRESPDRRLLAAPRSFSQLATSFIACQCQGIHHAPLVA